MPFQYDLHLYVIIDTINAS